jgi:isopenicillin-N epimerase
MDKTAEDLRARWALDDTITFLNHGSFGACPRAVLARQLELRALLEREPVAFFVRTADDLAATARAALGTFLGADPERLAALPNATAGVNTVLRSLAPRLHPGDELLVTNHEYNACRNALEFIAEATGSRVVVAAVPFPLAAPEAVTAALVAATTPRTRLCLVDHVTSQTGLVLPVADIARSLSARGVEVLVDGAHAPGMVPLDLRALEDAGVRYYTGNLHKWICAPKGAAFLSVAADRLDRIRPLSISHGANAPLNGKTRFRVEFDWTGTDDPTAFLSVPAALEVMAGLRPGGWPTIMAENREKALAGREILCAALGVSAPAPAGMIGSLAAVPLPDTPDGECPALQDALFEQDHIEVPIIPWPAHPRRLVRISAQLYNRTDEYHRLASVLRRRLGLQRA